MDMIKLKKFWNWESLWIVFLMTLSRLSQLEITLRQGLCSLFFLKHFEMCN